MSSQANVQPFPRGALVAAAGMILLAFAFAITARLTDIGASRLELPPVAETVALKFTDMPNGSVGVLRAADDRLLVALEPGEAGFVRVVLRGLAHDRAKVGAGPEQPFELSRHADGTLALIDPATGRIVTLSAFGFSNEEAFARLLKLGKASS
jgi:putative photosynthetic complex assembly protein